jgi:DNA polymerase III epsilon subunit-like protein
MPPTFYVCVDIEASGPNPHDFAMLSLGAATVDEPRRSFYTELQPTSTKESEEASQIHGLSLAQLAKEGEEPEAALLRLESWLGEVNEKGAPIVFVAFNAPFDWMFVNDYFQRFLGRNPFGHSALDMKALYMGLRGVSWEETSHANISRDYVMKEDLPHHAEEDALAEAELFARMLQELKATNPDVQTGS